MCYSSSSNLIPVFHRIRRFTFFPPKQQQQLNGMSDETRFQACFSGEEKPCVSDWVDDIDGVTMEASKGVSCKFIGSWAIHASDIKKVRALCSTPGSSGGVYNTSVCVRYGQPVAMECSCPAYQGRWCKHIVRVLMLVSNDDTEYVDESD